MPNISVATGLTEYVFNDKAKVYLNLTDPGFVKLLFNRFTEMEDKDKEWRGKLKAETDPAKVLDLADEGDKMFRGLIDDILGDGVADLILGSVSAVAFADGAPVWMNVFLALFDEMDETIKKEHSNPRIDKYLKKYHR